MVASGATRTSRGIWHLAICLSVLGVSACERVVDVYIPDPEPRLVVEGRIELLQGDPSGVGVQRIRLTTTDAFFSNVPAPPAVGATVTVEDGTGEVWVFLEEEPGLYVSRAMLARLGETYELIAHWSGDTYRASAMLTPVPPIDSLYFVFEELTPIIEEEGFRAAIDYTDPQGIENFYLWEQFVDGVREVPPNAGNALNFVSHDELYDGETITGFQPNDEIRVELGATVVVRQIALSRRAYNYYYAILEQSALGSGNPFSIPPATVRGNVVNTTNPDRFALGFFEAAEVSVASATLESGRP